MEDEKLLHRLRPPEGDPSTEWKIELFSALVQAIREDKESEDVVHRLAAAIAMLLHLSSRSWEQDWMMMDMLNALQASLSRVDNGGHMKEVKALLEEIVEYTPRRLEANQ